MADSVLWIASVTNTTATSGGSDPETDANLAERIRLAPTTFSVAGPEDAYIALTQGSRPDVESVSVNNSAPRVIDIYFTLTGGQIPSSDVIAEVSGYLNDKYRRPMSDVVNVRAPTTTTYTINLAYYIATADSARATAIQNAVTQAVADYVTWQQGAIGRDVNPSELIRRVMDAGALRVNITSPTYAAIDFAHLAVPASGQTVAFEGIVDP